MVISPADKYLSLSTSQCRYQAWVQDPQCTTVPCGLVVKSYGATVPGIMSAAECPSPAASGTLAGSLSQGAFLDVTGKVLVALDSTAPSTVIEHAILLDSVNLRPNAPTIQPTVLSDSTALASLASHTGSGWNQYEGMLVTLVPSTGPLTVTMASTGGFRTTPGNSDWGDTFESNYTPGAILFYPTDGLTFQSITGVVSARHGGNLLARNDPDFVP